MLSRPKTYAGRIKHADDATEPATLDRLSSIAPLFRPRPEIQDVCRFALQWEVVLRNTPSSMFGCGMPIANLFTACPELIV